MKAEVGRRIEESSGDTKPLEAPSFGRPTFAKLHEWLKRSPPKTVLPQPPPLSAEMLAAIALQRKRSLPAEYEAPSLTSSSGSSKPKIVPVNQEKLQAEQPAKNRLVLAVIHSQKNANKTPLTETSGRLDHDYWDRLADIFNDWTIAELVKNPYPKDKLLEAMNLEDTGIHMTSKLACDMWTSIVVDADLTLDYFRETESDFTSVCRWGTTIRHDILLLNRLGVLPTTHARKKLKADKPRPKTTAAAQVPAAEPVQPTPTVDPQTSQQPSQQPPNQQPLEQPISYPEPAPPMLKLKDDEEPSSVIV